MKTIEINGKEYHIEKGDYISSYGNNYQFHTGDGRKLNWFGFVRLGNINLLKSTVDKIDFSGMKSKTFPNGITHWFIYK